MFHERKDVFCQLTAEKTERTKQGAFFKTYFLQDLCFRACVCFLVSLIVGLNMFGSLCLLFTSLIVGLDVFAFCLSCLPQSELKTSKNRSKKAAEAEAKAEEEAATKSGGCSNKTVKFDNLINPKTLKAFDKKNVSWDGAHAAYMRWL